MRFSLAIPHTPWVEERKASLSRLLDSLGIGAAHSGGFAAFKCFTEKADNHIWSGDMWTWSADQEVDWCVFLQDDTLVAPDFAHRLEDWCVRPPPRTTNDPPAEVFGLQVAHPVALALYEEGYRWFTTNDSLVGVGYAVRRDTLKAFLEWRAALPSEVVTAITEDTLVAVFCASTGRKIYHALPTIVDHDTTIVSTYQNDAHENRRSLARWDAPPRTRESFTIPHLGSSYGTTPALVRVCGGSPELVKRLSRDLGHRELRKLSYTRRARGEHTGAKLYVAIPNQGSIVPETFGALAMLLRDESVDIEAGYEVVDVVASTTDIVRVRSRIVRRFLESDATHLLFVDSDISFHPQVVRGMLAAKKDFVAAPYPRRDIIDLDRAARHPKQSPKATAFNYSLRLLDKLDFGPDNCAEVEGVPLGCALLSREMLEKMTEHYAAELTVDDDQPPGSQSVWLFDLIRPLSEDFSFCKRWRDIDGKVWLYLGPGAPVAHHGSYSFQGAPQTIWLGK